MRVNAARYGCPKTKKNSYGAESPMHTKGYAAGIELDSSGFVNTAGAGTEGAGAGRDVAACNLWSNAFRAKARLRSASARVWPAFPPRLLGFMMLGKPPSTLALACSFPASMSSVEKGVQTFKDTRVL